MLKYVKLNACYGTMLNMTSRGVRKVVRVPEVYWEARAALFPYTLDGEFAVVAEIAKGGNRDFLKDTRAGNIKVGEAIKTDTYAVLWGVVCDNEDSQLFSMYHSTHSTIAFLVFPHHIKVDDNPNKLDFKMAYGIPTTKFITMVHIKVDTTRQPIPRNEVAWCWRTEEPIMEGWRYYSFSTPEGFCMYRVLSARNLTATEVKNHLHGGYPGVLPVTLVNDYGVSPMEYDYLYYCPKLNQVKRLSRANN